ncbi:MAG: hypothetical protein LH485_02560 [Sphingomonas bacterium]|nr:hypothetical protein [Sphingomonas bacterium]
MYDLLVNCALVVLWLTCLYLVLVGAAMLLAPDRALPLLSGFAQTARANLIESALRSIAGVAFVIAAPTLGHPRFIRWFGAFLAATALLFVVAPRLHKRFAGPAVASVAPICP